MTKPKQSAEDRLIEIHKRLESWNSFVRALDVPAELMPAFVSGRIELVKNAVPRPLSEAECKTMFELVGGLLETNAVLRDHAQAVADGAQIIVGNLRGTITTAARLERLANFDLAGVEGIESEVEL